jgi:preprotein translocase subunit SecB
MQLSPLQLDEIKFLSSRIDPRVLPDLENPGVKHEPHQFYNTKFSCTIEHVHATEIDENVDTKFIVAMTLDLPNEGENPTPYIIHIKCVGYFSILKSAFPDFTRRYDVGIVNGASLLYGAIREHISNFTARSWYGPLVLPSMNFQTYAPSNGDHIMVDAETTTADEKYVVKAKAKSKKKQ